MRRQNTHGRPDTSRHLVIRLLSVGLLLAGNLPRLSAETFTPSNLEPKLVYFFDHLLLTLGNLEDPAVTLQRRESATARIFSLNAQESGALITASRNFNTGLRPIRLALLSAQSERRVPTDNDRIELQSFTDERISLVRTVTAEFLNSLSSQAIARFKFAAEGGPKPRF